MKSSPTGPAESGEPDDYLGYTVVRLAAVLEARIERALRQQPGISVRHFGILAHLARQPGIGSGELARLVLITPQSIGGVLGTMERKGLIARARPETRGKPVILALTSAGRTALARGYETAGRLRTEEEKLLAPGEMDAANRVLTTLLEALSSPDRLRDQG